MIFAPLHIISGYTLLKSGLTIKKIARSVKANNYFGMALADIEALYGLPEFVKYAHEINKPYLLGEGIEINGDSLFLYIINEEGYKNLLKINLAVQKDELSLKVLEQYKDGLVAIIETARGTFKENFSEEISVDFTKYLATYSRIYKDNFFLGIEVTSREEINYANKIRKFANEYLYECVAFPRIRYEKKDDAIIIDIVNAIANDEKLEKKKATGQEYFMTENDYRKIYTKEELDNTIKIMNMSTFKFGQKRGEMVHFPVADSKEALKNKCFEALKNKGLDNKQSYVDRLNYELKTIIEMGYADYFLIVQDYVSYAKTHDIYVGPGRGSAAGALVTYLLGITEIDPLLYDLQFERFLNPYRKTMPDIDVDFMDNKREDVVNYVREKYGQNKVANIVTFQTILAKQSLRDIGRIYNIKTSLIDYLVKKLANKDYDLHEAYKKLPEFKQLIDTDKDYLEIVSLASKIEFLPRQTGIGAAGIILNDKALDEVVPVTIDHNGNYICDFEKDYLEELGFLKMDFLALSNLTTIDNCVKLINKNHPEVHLTNDNIPYDSSEIFSLIAADKVIGLFQIETPVMRRAIRILKPDSFKDVVALLALVRPGPMEYIPNYAKRKSGKEKITYINQELEPILKDTYGIIVYQEQINSIAQKMAGFTMGEADMFRRAISKKDKTKLDGLKKQFIDGCLKLNRTKQESEKVFADIEKFANYGFNKSHALVYSVITCRMAYLKAHYPLEFYTCLLGNGVLGSDGKFNDYITEIRSQNIQILPPSINHSDVSFVIKDNSLIYPLTAIRLINDSIVQKIVLERTANGPFTGFYEFVARMQKDKISDQQIENLIDAGVFDELCSSRASLRASILSARQYANVLYNEDGQLSIGISKVAPPRLIKVDDDKMDNINREYNAIGVMLSDHPLKLKRDVLKEQDVITIEEAKTKNCALIAGLILNKKIINTKKGEQMAYVRVFDETSDIEITIFPKLFKEISNLLEKNKILIIKGHIENNRDQQPIIVAKEIKNLEE